MPDAAVLFSTQLCNSGGLAIGHAELNDEPALNALTLDTVRQLDAQLAAWTTDPEIACIVISSSADHAFCVGGDLKMLRRAVLASENGQSGWHPHVLKFLVNEYRLVYRIATAAKPILVWGHGAVAGSGMSMLQAASHRIVTEHSQLATQEVRVGLFPNAGSSAFLANLPTWAGRYLALTGAPANASDALALNLADFALAQHTLPQLLSRLARLDWAEDPGARHSQLDELLSRLAREPVPALPRPLLTQTRPLLRELFESEPFEQLPERWRLARGLPDWLSKALSHALASAPPSQSISWRMQQWAQDKSLAEVLRKELGIVLAMMHAPDFIEGVRAQLVDKDKKPRWRYANVEQTPQHYLSALQATLWPAHEHPLRDLGNVPV
jgi:enoyl-CoA hydratase/carnithine racemase